MQATIIAVSFRQWCSVAVLLALWRYAQPLADDCFTYSTFLCMGHAICGICGALLFPQWL